MVTFAQAQERADEWINGDVPAYQHREVRVREFDLGFVVWAEDREDGPRSEGGRQRLVIARDSGEATLWPGLPVGEVIRRYEEEYAVAEAPAAAASPERVDLNQTSFLLSPPEWLQEAADQMGIGERRGAGASAAVEPEVPPAPAPFAAPEPVVASVPDATPWAGTDTNADDDDRSVSLPNTVTAPALSGSDEDDATPPAVAPDAKTALMRGGSQLPPTAVSPSYQREDRSAAPPPPPAVPAAPGVPGAPQPPSYGYPPAPPAPPVAPAGAPAVPAAPGVEDVPEAPQPPQAPQVPQGPAADSAEEAGAAASPSAGSAGSAEDVDVSSTPSGGPSDFDEVPAAEPAPTPPPASGPGAPGTPAGGYVPTQLVSALGPDGPLPPGPPAPPTAPSSAGGSGGGSVHQAATMFADPSALGAGGPGAPGAPGAPQPPGPPGVPGAPQPPGPPGAPGAPGVPQPPGPPGPPGVPGAPQPPGPPGVPGGSGGGSVHQAATMFADPSALGPGAPQPPGPPGAPQPPGPPGVPGAPGVPGVPGAPGAGSTPAAPAAPGMPGPPGTPGAPGAPGEGVHHAATMLAGPAVGGPGQAGPPPGPQPGQPTPPGPPGPPPGPPPGAPQPPQGPAPGQAPAYGYPQQPPAGQPTVGPGYQAVLRYRAQDGSEQQLIRRSAPGMPHPEWQILHELRGMNVPPQQVLELHTELESCELPGAYCARMIRETWPQARITSIAPYGTDHASRQQGMQQLLAHQGELHQVADGPARPAPVRVPVQPVQPAPPIPPDGVAQELAGAFGPQGIFRFDQRAVSRQGVPDIVAHTLMWSGLPVDVSPFFWAQAQPGRPVPTLAELAQERGVQPASDAGSYLVMGSDFGRAICVQYGTANIVAVPVEAGPGGAPAAPQFVNTGLPEFVRCLALLGRMWRLRYGLNQEQAGRWTVDFQQQLAALDGAALGSPDSWWSVLLEQMWDGLL